MWGLLPLVWGLSSWSCVGMKWCDHVLMSVVTCGPSNPCDFIFHRWEKAHLWSNGSCCLRKCWEDNGSLWKGWEPGAQGVGQPTIGGAGRPLCGPTTLYLLHLVPTSKYMACTSGTMLFVQNSLLLCLFPSKRDVLLTVLIM
jgi:hypothetical protein